MSQMKRSKKTVLVVTGGRADYGLLRPVMRELMKSAVLTLRVLATGMHTLERDRTLHFIRKDHLPIAALVRVGAKDTMLDALAKEIKGISACCIKHRPDLIMVLGDRDEPFAAAIVGGHLGIPVAHLHGGDKTGFVVDEYIRHAITKFSHLHFPATKKSAERIQKMGEELWRIAMVGGTGLDEIRTLSFDTKANVGKRFGLDPRKPWYLVLHHPTPLEQTAYEGQAKGVFAVAASLAGEKIFCMPNSDTGSDVFVREIEKYRRHEDVHIFQSMPREDFLSLFKHARTLIGNSSMGIIDSSFLKIPTINVGNRQMNREHGVNVIHATYDGGNIRRAVQQAESPVFRQRISRMKSPYGDGRASERIVHRIEKLIRRPDLFYKKLTYV
jgi:GDP/UDP-N,N'-diacetylbacillosamine 2-epimerase (hydrolysing)